MKFLDFFRENDVDRVKRAFEACDYFFNCLRGTYPDEIHTVDYGQIEFVLWGTIESRNAEYLRRHGVKFPGYSVCWSVASGTFESLKTEVWCRVKKLKNGKIVASPWMLQHETEHALDIALRLMGKPDGMSNPDKWVNEEFYR